METAGRIISALQPLVSGNKEVHTPTLDRLARGGLILDRHYVFK